MPDKIRILMGDETTHRTRVALLQAVKTGAKREVCCRPWQVTARYDETGAAEVQLEQAQ